MSFSIALRLLHQRRAEIIAQMLRSIETGRDLALIPYPNKPLNEECMSLKVVYRQVADEIFMLEHM